MPEKRSRIMIGTAIHAAVRADAFMEKGDMDGQAVWLRIMKTVDELLATERPEGAQAHRGTGHRALLTNPSLDLPAG